MSDIISDKRLIIKTAVLAVLAGGVSPFLLRQALRNMGLKPRPSLSACAGAKYKLRLSLSPSKVPLAPLPLLTIAKNPGRYSDALTLEPPIPGGFSMFDRLTRHSP